MKRQKQYAVVQEHDQEDFLPGKLADDELGEPPAGTYGGLLGAASATCSVASGVWKWLQVLLHPAPSQQLHSQCQSVLLVAKLEPSTQH